MSDDITNKLNTENNTESFEERFSRMSEELAAKREARLAEKAKTDPSAKVRVDMSGNAMTVYRSRTALASYRHKVRGEGAIKRTIRLVKGLKAAKLKADALPYCSAENRRAMYTEVYRDAWAPVANSIDNAADTLWGFLSSLGYDILEILVFIINGIIKIWYYAGSVGLFIWDKLWDFRLWLDTHKKGLFQIFATLVTLAAIALIGVSSMTGYEYSYYGRKLGTAKSKRDVYDVIETLGDKLSESAGANISLDVERDISFEKVYGVKMDIDTPDDILNTLTYMKDLRVEAYAVCINGEPVVYVDNEVTAESVITRAKDSFTPPRPGYEYLNASIAEEITVQPATIKLAELWNPAVAVRYIQTGSTEVLKEGEEARPKITVFATANVTEDESIAYSRRYVKNNNLYITEEVPVSAGKNGVRRKVSEVQLENGVEVSKVEQSSTVIQNPVDEVYETGTRPLPERAGSGTWLFPLKGNYTPTSPFGWRNTGIAGATHQHQGADLWQPAGSRIYAADGGVVAYAGYNGNFGLLVQINHGGLYETYYAHCSRVLVKVGETVAQGQVIALIGSTGVASGAHLHFEVHYNGRAIDPKAIFPGIYKGQW